ncbi:MAG: SpoIIE family protein phosphatase [Cyclobacteriaceae bacterium]|nr:SpoIIE family protein phosphatase [Cyclobacteriaceae bacterium]MCH8516762.1 SpoIIE family protein phosphatase [Cyclobacteriaceae bacterium]
MDKINLLLAPPVGLKVPTEYRKEYYVVAIASLLGFTVHSLFLALFVAFDVPFMAYFNLASLLIFAIIYYFNRSIKHYWLLMTNLACIEVIVHGILATLFLGWSSNFHLYFLLPILTTFLLSRGKIFSLSSTFFTVLSTISYVLVALFCLKNEPLKAISYDGLIIFSILNILSIVLVVTAITLYFNYAAESSFQEVAIKNEELAITSEQVQKQALQLQKVNTNLNASIHYAKRIQTAILPKFEGLSSIMSNHQVVLYFQPKDVISGDFYWCKETGSHQFLVVADCTGHGVPGAMLTMIGNSLLDNIILDKRITDPAQILDLLQEYFVALFDNNPKVRDGMDVAILAIEKNQNLYKYAGANRSLCLIQDDSLSIIKGDRKGIGNSKILSKKSKSTSFTTHELDMDSIKALYLFTDGYEDQFGGFENRKFYSKNLRKLLFEIHRLPTKEQEQKLAQVFEDWKGDNAQTDDVCLVGLKFNS